MEKEEFQFVSDSDWEKVKDWLVETLLPMVIASFIATVVIGLAIFLLYQIGVSVIAGALGKAFLKFLFLVFLSFLSSTIGKEL